MDSLWLLLTLYKWFSRRAVSPIVQHFLCVAVETQVICDSKHLKDIVLGRLLFVKSEPKYVLITGRTYN